MGLDLWALILSVVAFVWSVYTSINQLLINRQQKIINDVIIKAQNQADISAKVMKKEKCWYIVMTNIGKGKAEGIRVSFDGEELESRGIHIIAKNSHIEYPILNAGEFFDLLVMTEEWHYGRLLLEVSWNDDREGNIKRFCLSLSDFHCVFHQIP